MSSGKLLCPRRSVDSQLSLAHNSQLSSLIMLGYLSIRVCQKFAAKTGWWENHPSEFAPPFFSSQPTRRFLTFTAIGTIPSFW